MHMSAMPCVDYYWLSKSLRYSSQFSQRIPPRLTGIVVACSSVDGAAPFEKAMSKVVKEVFSCTDRASSIDYYEHYSLSTSVAFTSPLFTTILISIVYVASLLEQEEPSFASMRRSWCTILLCSVKYP
jgi:hypothetical protein